MGDSPQIWTRQLLSDQEWSQGILSSEQEGAKWQTFEEAGKALLEHDHYVRSFLLNTVTQWLNMLPSFVMNEIRVGSASGNDATTSQEPDRHASPASPESDIPQEWVSNLKDQRPKSNMAKPKSDLWQSYNIGLPPVGQRNGVSFEIPQKPVPDYNNKKGKVVMINPFTMEDPSKEPVVDQSVRPHLYQDVHSLTRTSRLNPTAPSYTPSYVKR